MTAKNLLIWAGPVDRQQLGKPVLLPDTTVLTIGHGEPAGAIGSTGFANLGRRVKTLRALVAEHHLDVSEFGTVTLAGFSAAWGLFEQLFRDPESLARIDALVASDSYYVGVSAPGKPLIRHPGYVALCDRAVASNVLAVFTTSYNGGPPANPHPSAAAAVAELVKPYALETRQVPIGLPTPSHCCSRGGLLWLDYQGKYTHGQHATELAPRVLTNIVTPYLTHRQNGESPALALLAIGLLFAALAAAT